jgi:thiamine kinase-like enzyme
MVIPPGSSFQLPPQTEHEVICHNDFAPYNLVFRDEHLVGIIDFDLAGPGTRLWDMAYAVYRFAPLSHDAHCRDLGWEPIPDKQRRLSLFCDAYGLQNREALISTVIKRLEFLVQYMQDTGSNLDHLPVYLQDLAYIRHTFTADHPSQ